MRTSQLNRLVRTRVNLDSYCRPLLFDRKRGILRPVASVNTAPSIKS